MSQPKLVVRSHQPRRLGVLLGVGGVAFLLVAFVLYEWGRYKGGYDGLRADRERRALLDELDEVKSSNRALREEIAMLTMSRDVDHEAYLRVESSLSDLQSTIQEQREQLAFYRGIVSPKDGASGLQIQELVVSEGPVDSEYRLNLTLVMAAARHDRSVSGSVEVALEGAHNGEPARFLIGDLLSSEPGDAKGADLAFKFRYFQRFERDLQLPAGFVPDRVTVEVNPKGRSAKVIRRAFEWSVQSTQES
ncbi:MAG: DUF6776 family protein [Pseudomonadota bacterium]